MKILVTGSHFTPAQATIQQLQERFKAEVVYIGRRFTREGDSSESLESQVLPKMGVKFIPLTTGRLQRSFTIYTIPSLLKVPIGFIQSILILLKEKPDVVLSFGGYIAVPVVIASWILSIPIIIHEQTLVTGLANKITSIFARKIAVSFSNHNFNFPKSKVVVAGNPIRRELLSVKPKKTQPPTILVTAGNQGSHIINMVMAEAISQLTKEYQVIHQTGESSYHDYEELVKVREKLAKPERYLLKKYLTAEEMGEAMGSASLAIIRGGMNTLLELAQLKVPAIIIPIANHFEQTTNAKYFEDNGMGIYLKQDDLTAKKLFELIADKKSFEYTKGYNSEVVIPDAASTLALETALLYKGN